MTNGWAGIQGSGGCARVVGIVVVVVGIELVHGIRDVLGDLVRSFWVAKVVMSGALGGERRS